MPGRTLFRLGFLVFVINQSPFALCQTQSNACTDTSSDETESSEGPKIIIDNIEYLGDNPFSDAQRSAVLRLIKKIAVFDSTESIQEQDTLDYLSIAIESALQDSGYFRAVVTPRIFLVRAEPDAVHYVFSVSIHSGLQYHLGTVHFRSTDPDQPSLAFSERDLRQQLALKQGDLFDVSKVRDAVDSLDKLYHSKGFIDMVPTPDQQIHEPGSRHDNPNAEDASDAELGSTIDLTIAIDEGEALPHLRNRSRGPARRGCPAIATSPGCGRCIQFQPLERLLRQRRSTTAKGRDAGEEHGVWCAEYQAPHDLIHS